MPIWLAAQPRRSERYRTCSLRGNFTRPIPWCLGIRLLANCASSSRLPSGPPMSCVLDSGIMPVRRPHRLWNFDKPYRWNGVSGGAGVGYNLPASLGAALANKQHGRLTVSFGGDGDFMFAPGTLWTAAHHRIPMLYIVQNNR